MTANNGPSPLFPLSESGEMERRGLLGMVDLA
jgi:hypothetical protein